MCVSGTNAEDPSTRTPQCADDTVLSCAQGDPWVRRTKAGKLTANLVRVKDAQARLVVSNAAAAVLISKRCVEAVKEHAIS
jgi:hypothetical protein